MRSRNLIVLLVGASLGGCSSHKLFIVKAQHIILAGNGQTNYVIAADCSSADIKLAVEELTAHLKEATGANFSTATVPEAEKLPRRIVVGNNSLSRSLLGTHSFLKPEESLITVKGSDVILVGGSPRATLYAVYSFLENEVGCRWYACHLEPFVPRYEKLLVKKLGRREGPAFPFRYGGFNKLTDQRDNSRFFLRNRMFNVEGFLEIGPNNHSLFFYIPPHEFKSYWAHWGHPPLKNFFETHPDFFSMTASGQRVDTLQLCFSNPELRKTLTSQIDAVIKQAKPQSRSKIALEANDVPGKFCHCSACQELEKKYENVGGPLYDYLFELSSFLEREHPKVFVKVIAYRKKQTEFPPNIRKLPENVIVHFAPIDDNFATGLEHPTNVETLNNLKRWCKIARHVWVWYYTNPFMSAGPPFSSLKCAIDDLRKMHEIGVTGVTFQQTTSTTDKIRGFNLADLQSWLLMKLTYNPDRDAEKLIDEFAKAYFGKAAPLIRTYIDDLEAQREQMTVKLPWNPSLPMFTYLRPVWIMRWQAAFDQMEKLVADSPDPLRHVRTLRITLDAATLGKWREVRNDRPGVEWTPRQLRDRIMSSFSAERDSRCLKGLENRFLGPFGNAVEQKVVAAEVTVKALPAFFNKFVPERIRDILPPVAGMTEDSDGACGRAIVRKWEGGPVKFGVHDSYNDEWLTSRTINNEEIKPDRFQVYKLGRATISPRCILWFTDSWIMTVPLDEAYVEGDALVELDIYVSLKFEGPKYGSEDKNKPNRISCDRVILVRARGK